MIYCHAVPLTLFVNVDIFMYSTPRLKPTRQVMYATEKNSVTGDKVTIINITGQRVILIISQVIGVNLSRVCRHA